MSAAAAAAAAAVYFLSLFFFFLDELDFTVESLSMEDRVLVVESDTSEARDKPEAIVLWDSMSLS